MSAQAKTLKIIASAAAALLGAALLSACGPGAKEWQPETKKPKVFTVAFRQLPPEPVYNQARWVHLPEPLPSRRLPYSHAPQIHPVFYMQLKNATVEEAALALAAGTRYGSYCASSVATRRVSINSLGTSDELAAEIARQAEVDIYVDHVNRQVRVMARRATEAQPVSPSFLAQPAAQAAD